MERCELELLSRPTANRGTSAAASSRFKTGAKTGKLWGEIGLMKKGELLLLESMRSELFDPDAMMLLASGRSVGGELECIGTENGLNGAAFFCCCSSTILSVGSRAKAGGSDSFSRNETNSSEKD